MIRGQQRARQQEDSVIKRESRLSLGVTTCPGVTRTARRSVASTHVEKERNSPFTSRLSAESQGTA